MKRLLLSYDEYRNNCHHFREALRSFFPPEEQHEIYLLPVEYVYALTDHLLAHAGTHPDALDAAVASEAFPAAFRECRNWLRPRMRAGRAVTLVLVDRTGWQQALTVGFLLHHTCKLAWPHHVHPLRLLVPYTSAPCGACPACRTHRQGGPADPRQRALSTACELWGLP